MCLATAVNEDETEVVDIHETRTFSLLAAIVADPELSSIAQGACARYNLPINPAMACIALFVVRASRIEI